MIKKFIIIKGYYLHSWIKDINFITNLPDYLNPNFDFIAEKGILMKATDIIMAIEQPFTFVFVILASISVSLDSVMYLQTLEAAKD